MDGAVYSACTSPKNYTGLSVGAHTFTVKATDAAGNTDPTPASYTWTVNTTVFSDIVDNPYRKYIEAAYSFGITSGCKPNYFCPTNPATRAQMAVMILRAVNGKDYYPPDTATVTFSDVPVTHWAHDWIEEFYAQGFTSGYADGTYRPEGRVNRAQAAVFVVKGKYGVAYVPPAVVTPTFSDTPANYFLPYIEQMVADGITAGCGGGKYCPASNVTRQQMAIFLVRAFNLPIAP
jgi:hypothetical protein